jgi:hypothetical protein
MKVELHLHTSRYSACATATPAELMEALIAAGYEAVFITEHDATWSQWELEQLQGEHPNIRIFAGVELSLPRGSFQHLLVLGTCDRQYLSWCDDPAALLDKARREGCLTALAHPFRWEESSRMLGQGLRPDAIELRTCNHDGAAAERAIRTARDVGLKCVNAGDVHGLDVIGCFWIETDRPLKSAQDIRSIVLEGAYRNCSRDA